MSKSPYVGAMVVVHDRGRPQAGRDVHPAVVTQVISDDLVEVKVLVAQGVDYPIKSIAYMHGERYMEGFNWRWPEDDDKASTSEGVAQAPAPQDTNAPTPGDHEPRTVAGEAVAKPGDAPKAGEGSDVTGDGSLAAQDGQTDAAEGTGSGEGTDAFADLTAAPVDGKKPEDGVDSASVSNAEGNKADTAAGAKAGTSETTTADGKDADKSNAKGDGKDAKSGTAAKK